MKIKDEDLVQTGGCSNGDDSCFGRAYRDCFLDFTQYDKE